LRLQVINAGEQGTVVLPAGLVDQRFRKVGLANTGGSDDDEVVAFVDPLALRDA